MLWVWGLGFWALGLWLRAARALGFRVQGFEFRALGFTLYLKGSGLLNPEAPPAGRSAASRLLAARRSPVLDGRTLSMLWRHPKA